jgi:aldose 1-epimerase
VIRGNRMNICGHKRGISFISAVVALSLLIAGEATRPVALSNEKEKPDMPSSRYSVVKDTQEGMTVYILKDQKAECKALIVPEFGNNCFSYSFVVDGERIDVLDPPPSLDALKQRSSGFGNPVLFPFPNRIREGRFSFEGQDYQFDTPRPGANSIHGLVIARPWNVEKAEASDENGAQLVSSIKSTDFSDIIRQYPFLFHLCVTYTLKDGILSMLTEVENLGERNMPMGYGIHPYFCAPLSKSSSPEECQIILPARKYWELKDFLPTGQILEASGRYNLRDGVSAADIKFDDVFTDLIMTDGVSRCIVDDKKAKMRMILESDAIFREMVVYTPPGRPAVCFEPYTCPTDAINLHQHGIDARLIVLEPGESISATVKIIFEKYAQ